MAGNQSSSKTHHIPVDGMTCAGCERRIEKALGALPGVRSVRADWRSGTVRVGCEGGTGREKLEKALDKLHYPPRRAQRQAPGARVAGTMLVLLAVYLLLRHTGLLRVFSLFPQAEETMGLGMIFLTGLFTSVHCVAMCGGIGLSQSLPAGGEGASPLRPSLLYNAGRVVSYTLVGALVGALGSVLQFSGAARGVVQLAAGVFMVLMGLNLIGAFPRLRVLLPRLPGSLGAKLDGAGQGRGPLLVGLLNGLMPCGPLQAMQLYALSTGSALRGGAAMLAFALGTAPLLFAVGALGGSLGKRFRARAMTVGAALVVLMGVNMFSTGLALSRLGATPSVQADGGLSGADSAVQTVTSGLVNYRYQPITVQAGVPVQWNLQADPGQITGCNSRLYIPEWGIELALQPGDNLIEFTPEQPGEYLYMCWMGMIRSQITVEA